MDIHRSRFVPYPSSAINALAFSHTDTNEDGNDPECLRLALGRANGNIEIWNPANGSWSQERVFSGGKDRSVEGLAWTQEPDQRDDHGKIIPGRLRLFSIGYSSSVTEWDLATGLPLRHSDGNHSEVWCFAAQPQAKASMKGSSAQEEDTSQKLIAGCADGSLVLLSTADDDLRFEKFVARSSATKARVLSVTFKDRKIVLAGFADSMIRVYDTRNGYVIRNISLGSAGPRGPKETLVWNIKCLPNGDFVSGDSNGDVRIYDGRNYSHVQRISGHEADVLDLAVSRDGTMIFSGGMDRRTCLYTSKKKTAPGAAGQGGNWTKVSHQRYHDHDVKAMATYDGAKLSILASGGIDTRPIVVPIRQFGKELSRGLSALPHTPPLASAPDARLVVSWWNCELRVWRVKTLGDGTEKPKAVARLALQGDENITSATITHDGGLLAVATVREVRLFQLIETSSEAGSGVRIRKLDMPLTIGARIVRFTPDGKWLAMVSPTNNIFSARIVRSDDLLERPRVLQKLFPLHRLPREHLPSNPLNGLTSEYGRAVMHAEFSTDGTVFAVADLAGYIDTWVTEGHEDLTAPEVDVDEAAASSVNGDESDDEENAREQITLLGQRWIRNPSAHLLPRLDSAPALLSFQPTVQAASRPEPNGNPAVHPTRNNPHPHSHDIPDTEHRLLVVSADRQLYLFDVLGGQLSEWSRRNPPSIYPSRYRALKSSAKGCIWDVTEQERIWLYGEDWLFMFDLSGDLPIPESADASDLASGADEVETSKAKKRKREANARKGKSGAGDAVPENDAPVTKMRRYHSAQDDPTTTTQMALHEAQTITNSDDEYDNEHDALTSLRRQDSATNGMTNGNGSSKGMELVRNDADDASEQRSRDAEGWWHTFKYRPILGVVPIGGGEGEPLEVVLVERPSWDLDLPPKFMGAHEG